MWLLNNEALSKRILLMKIFHLHIILFNAILIGSYTPQHTSLSGLVASTNITR